MFRVMRCGRVEDGRSGLGHPASPCFPSPLIKPDVPISGIRLSDWFHLAAVGGAPMCSRRSRSTPNSSKGTAKPLARSKPQLKQTVVNHMRSLSKRPERIRAFFRHPQFRYAA